jgi:hypothetical protein
MTSNAGIVLLTTVVVALAGSGCGTSGNSVDNHYVDQVNQAQHEFAQTVQGLSGATTPTSSVAQRQAALGRFEGAVSTIVARFKAIKPPQKVASLHQQLIGEIAGFGSQVQTASTALSSRDRTKLQSASARLLTRTTATANLISATIDAINKKLHG